MDRIGSNRLKYNEIDRSGMKWTEVAQMDQSGPKCYANVIQKERSNNKCYVSTFRYYILG